MSARAKLLALALVLATTGSAADVSSAWDHASDQYSPPLLANGDLCALVDYRNMMAQDVPSYKAIRCTGGLYRPSIYREGRRTDNRNLACLGRIEERVSAGGASDVRPVCWGQTLDVQCAISTVSNSYAGGTEISSEAFILADAPVLAVRKSFAGTPPDEYVFEYLFRRPDSDDAKPLHTEWSVREGVLSMQSRSTRNGLPGRACCRSRLKRPLAPYADAWRSCATGRMWRLRRRGVGCGYACGVPLEMSRSCSCSRTVSTATIQMP